VLAAALAEQLQEDGYEVLSHTFFDTIVFKTTNSAAIRSKAEAAQINFRYYDNNLIGISLDETTTYSDVLDILLLLNQENDASVSSFEVHEDDTLDHIPTALTRTSEFLTHPVFNSHHSETQMMRYIRMLEG